MELYNEKNFILALEYYADKIVKKNGLYLSRHIKEICDQDNPTLVNTYASHCGGYCNARSAFELIKESKQTTAKKIINLTRALQYNTDSEFEKIEIEETSEVTNAPKDSKVCIIQ
jgi:hypothetical protein